MSLNTPETTFLNNLRWFKVETNRYHFSRFTGNKYYEIKCAIG